MTNVISTAVQQLITLAERVSNFADDGCNSYPTFEWGIGYKAACEELREIIIDWTKNGNK